MIMPDSNMSDEWIKRVLAANPCKLLEGGSIRTCPVRLSFPHILEKADPVEIGKPGAYSACLVFPVIADLSLLKAEAGRVAVEKWPQALEGVPKLKSPFLDQGEMLNYGAFVEGGVYIRAVAYENRPPCVDQRLAPITDKSRIYPGVWAVATIRPFTYDKGVNKGVSFGLNSVMIVADDTQLGGGGSNPQADFEGVAIDAEVNPASMFGGGAPAGQSEEAARKALFG